MDIQLEVSHQMESIIWYVIGEKNKAMWVKENDVKQEFLYSSAGRAIRAIIQLLSLMPDYATDKLSIVMFENGNIFEGEELIVKDISDDEWNIKFKVTKKR